jgi:hypothetical protein
MRVIVIVCHRGPGVRDNCENKHREEDLFSTTLNGVNAGFHNGACSLLRESLAKVAKNYCSRASVLECVAAA